MYLKLSHLTKNLHNLIITLKIRRKEKLLRKKFLKNIHKTYIKTIEL